MSKEVAEAFVSADISLHKLNHNTMKNLFTKLGCLPPSQLLDSQINKVEESVRDKDIFMVVDESEKNGNRYLIILVGCVAQPSRDISNRLHIS